MNEIQRLKDMLAIVSGQRDNALNAAAEVQVLLMEARREIAVLRQPAVPQLVPDQADPEAA
jgi:hypothetical protein